MDALLFDASSNNGRREECVVPIFSKENSENKKSQITY